MQKEARKQVASARDQFYQGEIRKTKQPWLLGGPRLNWVPGNKILAKWRRPAYLWPHQSSVDWSIKTWLLQTLCRFDLRRGNNPIFFILLLYLKNRLTTNFLFHYCNLCIYHSYLVALNFAGKEVTKDFSGVHGTIPDSATVEIVSGVGALHSKGESANLNSLSLAPSEGIVVSWDYKAKELWLGALL